MEFKSLAKNGQLQADHPPSSRRGNGLRHPRTVVDAVVPEGTSSPRQLRRDAAYRRSLAISDLLAVAVATAGVLAPGKFDSGLALFATLPVVILVSKAVGLYDRDGNVLHKTTLDEVPRLFQVSTLYALSASIASPVFLASTLAASEVAGLWALLFVSLVLGRIATRAVIKRLSPPERCLAIGNPTTLPALREKLADNPSVRVELV